MIFNQAPDLYIDSTLNQWKTQSDGTIFRVLNATNAFEGWFQHHFQEFMYICRTMQKPENATKHQLTRGEFRIFRLQTADMHSENADLRV